MSAGVAVVVIAGVAVWLNLPVRLPGAGHSLPVTSGKPVPFDNTGSGAGRIPPDANPAAFAGQGRLAFISQGLLYDLDGKTGQLKQLTESGQAASPSWSPDGQWLAYVRVTDAQSGWGPLWLVRSDGTRAHQVQGLPGPVGEFRWSPTADVLAVGQQKGIWLVSTRGKPEQLAVTVNWPGFLWSPDGKFLACSVTLPWSDPVQRSDALYTVAADGGRPVQRLTAPRAGIQLAAWWPDGQGLLYWLDPEHSASLQADGLGLWSLRLGESTPKFLATGLTHPNWLSFSLRGRLLMVKGGLRIVWANKQLETIDVATGTGEKLPNLTGNVAIDPSFSADGGRIAFVAAKDLGSDAWGFNSDSQLAAWVATRTLWVENADGSNAHPLVSAGTGVYQPAWSRDGKSILYVRDNALWVVSVAGGSPQRIVGLSAPQYGLMGSYGYVYYGDYAWFEP